LTKLIDRPALYLVQNPGLCAVRTLSSQVIIDVEAEPASL
jgi:hypothetical protein